MAGRPWIAAIGLMGSLGAWWGMAVAADETLVLGHAETPLIESLTTETQAPRVLPDQVLVLSRADMARLTAARPGDRLDLPSLAGGLAKSTDLAFERFHLYAPGARIMAVEAGHARALQPSRRLYFRAGDPWSSVAFALDPEAMTVSGYLRDGIHSYVLTGQPVATGIEIAVTSLEHESRDAVMTCGNESHHRQPARLQATGKQAFSSLSAMEKGGALLYQTTIAVDTDNEWLLDKFANNTTTATTWIEDLFTAMNAIFETDLAMRLLIGDVFLRVSTTPDPYTETNPGNFLNEFGTYWFNNLGGVDRDFALLLSGRSIASNSFSGVAWLQQYCQNGFQFGNPVITAGSYSVNRVGTSLSAGFASGGIAHEIGHNLGSSHTHCEFLRNGGTAYVDTCYSCEDNDGMSCDASDCFVGATACPVGGVGSIMSYCHAPSTGFDGGGLAVGPPQPCTNSDDFDPLIITKLSGLIATNNPSCIADFAGANEVPVAVGDRYFTDTDTALNVAAAGVLINDTDADMDMLSAVLDSGPSNAQSFNLMADGSFSYTPAAAFEGQDSFTYHANDGTADSNTVTVTIDVGVQFRDGFEEP